MKLNLSIVESAPIADGSPVTNAGGVARTYWDVNGVLRDVTDGSLRFTYDPSDLSAAPYPLIEPAATNYLLFSKQLDNAVWGKSGVGESVTPDAALAPDGTMTADAYVCGSSTGNFAFLTQNVAGLDASLDWCYSFLIRIDSGTSQIALAISDLSFATKSSDWQAVDASWRLVSFPLAAGRLSSTSGIGVGLFGVAGQKYYISDPQLERGSKPSSRIVTAGAAVTRPADVIGPDVGLTYSSLAENDADDAPLYNPATTYAAGARVRRAETHSVYESNIDGNTGNTPELNATGDDAKWMRVGPTNKWAMFDGDVSTPSTAAGSLTVVFRPGAINALYGGGIDADLLQVCVQDAPGGNIITSYTTQLESSAPGDYDEYFWGRFKPQTDFLLTDLDPYHQSIVTVTLTKVSGTVKCSVLRAGDQILLAASQRGAKAKPKSYSYIKVDDFGNASIKRRKATKDLSGTAWVERAEASWVEGVIERLLDVPVVLLVSDDDQDSALRGYGLLSAELSWDYPQDVQLSFSLQGIINANSDTAA